MTDIPFFDLMLPDFDEPQQWRQARLDTLGALEWTVRDRIHHTDWTRANSVDMLGGLF